MEESPKLPKGALRFVAEGCHAVVEMIDTDKFAEDGKTPIKKPKLKMVGYSGGLIKGHWYWDTLAIDLEGIQFSQKRYPILEDHMVERKIAHIGKPVIENGKLKAPEEDAVFLSSEAAEEFVSNSQHGFPYQASIYAKPSNVERLEEGATAKVNGMTMKGPGSIWRACEFKEMSVCVFGWDTKTQSSAFSKEELEECAFTETVVPAGKKQLINRRKEVTESMNMDELKEKHPDLYDQIVAAATTAAEAKFAKKETAFTEEIEALQADNKSLQGDVESLKASDEKRGEREMSDQADKIWSRKLSASELPDRLHAKVKKHVSHHKFVDDKGRLDVDAFGEAIDAEIKDWKGLSVSEDSAVEGETFTEKQLEDETKLAEENTTLTDRLLKHAGQETKTD